MDKLMSDRLNKKLAPARAAKVSKIISETGKIEFRNMLLGTGFRAGAEGLPGEFRYPFNVKYSSFEYFLTALRLADPKLCLKTFFWEKEMPKLAANEAEFIELCEKIPESKRSRIFPRLYEDIKTVYPTALTDANGVLNRVQKSFITGIRYRVSGGRDALDEPLRHVAKVCLEVVRTRASQQYIATEQEIKDAALANTSEALFSSKCQVRNDPCFGAIENSLTLDDVIALSAEVNKSVHWLLNLSAVTPLYSEDGRIDVMFGLFTTLSHKGQDGAINILKAVGGAL